MPIFSPFAVVVATSVILAGCQSQASLLGRYDSVESSGGAGTGGRGGGAASLGDSSSSGGLSSSGGNSASSGPIGGNEASGGSEGIQGGAGAASVGGSGGSASNASGGAPVAILPIYGAPIVIDSIAAAAGTNSDPAVTGNGLELFFMSNRDENMDIYHVTRESRADSWSTPSLVASLSSDAIERNVRVSSNGLRIWFFSDRDRSFGTLWEATRLSPTDEFTAPKVIAGLSRTDGSYISAGMNADATIAVVSAQRPLVRSDYELIEMTRGTPEGVFVEKRTLSSLNSDKDDYDPWLSDDGLMIAFHSNRNGNDDLFVSSRRTLADRFDNPQPIAATNTEMSEAAPSFTTDLSLLSFASNRDGVETICVAKAQY